MDIIPCPITKSTSYQIMDISLCPFTKYISYQIMDNSLRPLIKSIYYQIMDKILWSLHHSRNCWFNTLLKYQNIWICNFEKILHKYHRMYGFALTTRTIELSHCLIYCLWRGWFICCLWRRRHVFSQGFPSRQCVTCLAVDVAGENWELSSFQI